MRASCEDHDKRVTLDRGTGGVTLDGRAVAHAESYPIFSAVKGKSTRVRARRRCWGSRLRGALFSLVVVVVLLSGGSSGRRRCGWEEGEGVTLDLKSPTSLRPLPLTTTRYIRNLKIGFGAS